MHCQRRTVTHRIIPYLYLQDVREGVVGHVDGAVGERLDEELRVPGDARAQAEGAGAGPLEERGGKPEGWKEGGVEQSEELGRVAKPLQLLWHGWLFHTPSARPLSPVHTPLEGVPLTLSSHPSVCSKPWRVSSLKSRMPFKHSSERAFHSGSP